jgi:hypothetical protein
MLLLSIQAQRFSERRDFPVMRSRVTNGAQERVYITALLTEIAQQM